MKIFLKGDTPRHACSILAAAKETKKTDPSDHHTDPEDGIDVLRSDGPISAAALQIFI